MARVASGILPDVEVDILSTGPGIARPFALITADQSGLGLRVSPLLVLFTLIWFNFFIFIGLF